MISRTLLVLLGSALAADALPLAAATFQNVVPNPDFSANANGWAKQGTSSPTGVFAWDGTEGSPALGSAHISDITTGGSNVAQTTGCTAITNGNFDLIANVKTGAGTSAYVSVMFFNASSCSLLNSISSTGIGAFPTALGNGWLQGSMIDQTPPSIATYAQFMLQAYNPTGAADAHFDHIVYGLTGIADVIFADHCGG